MSKWRPSKECLYVIPDVHGQLKNLKLILNRILPLRKSEGIKDRLIMLGDYIDRRLDGPEVVDLLIELKEKYKNQLILLTGNHENMLLNGIASNLQSNHYLMWMKNGGEQTLQRYLERIGEKFDNPYLFPRHRIKDIIPKSHINFYGKLDYYHETEDFIFVHGGCNPSLPLFSQSKLEMIWDRSLYKYIIQTKGKIQNWDRVIITGHNGGMEGPIITNKYLMLDNSFHGNLLVYEANSKSAFIAVKNNKKLIQYSIKNTWGD